MDAQPVIYFDTTPVAKRCTRGHEWTDIPWQPSGLGTLTVGGEVFCMRCLLEWLRSNAGRVEVVPPADCPVTVEGTA